MSFTPPVPLTAEHDLSAFDCGKDTLNLWLRRRALANQDSGASRTFVILSKKRVVGYYALAAGSVSHATATRKLRRNIPDPVPVALLARLAVDATAQGFGIGAGLLQDALLRVHNAAQSLGIRGILVDALDEEAAAFYEKFGFRRSQALPLKLMITLRELDKAVGA